MSALASSVAAPASDLALRIARLFTHAGLVDEADWQDATRRTRANKPIFEAIGQLGQDVSLRTVRDFFLSEVNPFKFKSRSPELGPALGDAVDVAFDELARMLSAWKTPEGRVIRTLEAAQVVEPGRLAAEIERARQMREEPYPWLVRNNLVTPDVLNRFFAADSNPLPKLCSLYIAMGILDCNGIAAKGSFAQLAAMGGDDHAAGLSEARRAVPLTSSELLERARSGLALPQADMASLEVSAPLLDLFPAQFIRRHQFLPVEADDRRIRVAICDPLDLGLAALVKWITGMWLEPLYSPESLLEERIERCYAKSGAAAAAVPSPAATSAAARSAALPAKAKGKKGKKEPAPEREEPNGAAEPEPPAAAPPSRPSMAPSDTLSAVQLVSSVFESAIDLKATDIHLEPSRAGMSVRFRIDGVLCKMLNMPDNLIGPVTSRIKVLASMDVTERRRPQDGHITLDMADRHFDFRIATLPTSFGEKVAIRILDSARVMTGLRETGMNPAQLEAAERLIRLPYGVILVTGPTGSGKTSTLYAALKALNHEKRHLVTIEDPIEYQLPGINQVQVDTNIGLDFSEGLRAILRQDPNIIMVGEIRDPDTAAIAMRAALTGHLVFSTLHTNTAIGAFQAMAQLGATPYMIGSAVAGVIAQRLVRRLCEECSRPAPVTKAMAQQLGLKFTPKLRLARAVGCEACLGTGYSGRVGLFEVLEMGEKLRHAVLSNESPAKLSQIARAAGGLSLRDAGIEKARLGVTSPEEVIEKVLLDS